MFVTAVECEAPLVYKECYDRICETGCAELLEENPCPPSEGSCFPGCYCPDGFVRDEKRCVKPAECRDCEYLMRITLIIY